MIHMTGTSAWFGSTGTFNIPVLTYTGTSLVGSLSTGEFSIPMLIMSGISSSGSYGTFRIPPLVMSDISPFHSYGTFDLPVLEFSGFGRLIPISPIYRGVVMNLINQAISTYSNYPFNSLAYFNGKYLGATDTGIYVLDGGLDNGSSINAKIKTGPMDFGKKAVKYIRDVWLTYRTDGHLALVFSIDEDNSTEVERQTTLVEDELQEEKIKVPRGLKGRYYTIELKNLSGADFDIDSIEVMVDALTGRKR